LSFRYYLLKLFFFLTPPLLAVLLYFYGGDAGHFDYIYIGALCTSCVFCGKDRDALGALLILLGYWCFSKPLFWAPDNPIYWFVIYVACFGVSFYYLNHITAKILLILVLFTVGAEIYWWSIAYENKPRMIYWIGLLALTVWLRQLLFNRIFLMHEYFGHTSGKVALDSHIGKILLVYYALVVLMIIEYFARHLGNVHELLLIYNLFTPVSTLISALTLAVIYMHYFYNQSQKYLTF
jgi:hypothetical protein